ncbi:hypothetical protein [Streptomyces griseosporeus]|uniref:hypothetical protein n=1 Tax=Streptomyces griseosporeus TaxID=1910 RepID=UPI00167CB100|nr:hypothetical protein [Streptomyces griseosporeus]GHF50447.1 hypothetical protein GCM10018783_18810 [Streptomyces griseosporeus]
MRSRYQAVEVPQGGVGPVDHDHPPRHTAEVAVEGDPALQIGAEADQGIVKAGDIAPVRDRRQVLRPQIGDAGVVEGQGVRPNGLIRGEKIGGWVVCLSPFTWLSLTANF